MTRDTLFLLPPGFFDNERWEYCPECAEMWGLLSWYPAIKESLDIVYVGIDKPRPALEAVLGDKNQNAPTLLLHPDSPLYDDVNILRYRGQHFINNARDIGAYYSKRFGTAWPRGHS